MKKKVKIIIGAVCSLLGLVILIPVIYFFVLTDTIELTKIPAPDIQEQLDIYVEAGLCRRAKMNEDETAAIIHLTRYQRQKWIKRVDEDLEYMLGQANRLQNMTFEISNDAKELTLSANENMNFSSAGTYVLILTYDMELFQVLNGEADWKIDFILKDMDTGEILYTEDYPEKNIRVEEEMWN